MAAGIIDHETGTRDIRRLSGLCRSCRSPATLAHRRQRGDGRRAAAQRLPVEGDVLRRDRLHPVDPRGRCGLPIVATLAGMFSVAYSLRFVLRRVLRAAVRGRCRATPHEPPRWMRVPVELLVLVCLVVGVRRRWPVGPFLAAAARAGASAARCRPTAWRCGTASTLPLLMSLVALAGGVAALRVAAHGAARAARSAHAAAAAASTASASSRACSSRPERAGRAQPARCSARGGCSRSCCCWSRSRWPAPARRLVGARRLALGHARAVPLSPTFALIWLIGGACARRRGLAGEVPSAGRADAGSAAPGSSLPHVHLVLGAGPGADATHGRDGDHGADPARAALAAEAHRQVATTARARLRHAGAARRDLAIAIAAGAGMAALA